MLKVTKAQNQDAIVFITSLRERQHELKLERKNYYPSITMHTALKYRIFFPNLLLHPKVLEARHFYENRTETLLPEELAIKIANVLEYEFLEKETLTKKEQERLIKLHKKLTK